MSDSHHAGDATEGTKKTEDMKGSVDGKSSSDVMMGEGDIGNPPPPRENFPQVSTEKEEKDKQTTQPAPPASDSDLHPLSYSLPIIVSPSNNMATRGHSPTPPPPDTDGESADSESTLGGSSIMGDQTSPPEKKRSFVYSAREHEETDDFLLSTMLAIRTAVLAGTRDATKVEATPEDFSATRKHKISMAGDRKVEVKDYAPVIFTLLRRHFGVSIPSYLLSWSDSRLAKSKSAGKSDSMFIHSPDNKFILKTLAREEAKRLCKILRPYYEHLIENKDTFLSRFYGLHRMSRRRGQSDIYFAIFNNVFDSGHSLSEIYDLKGSTVGRRASCEQPAQRRSSTSFEFRTVRKAIEQEQAQPAKKPTVLKDLDFTRKLHVGPENRAKVLAQLAKDAKFLSQHQLMDYSLLIGVRRTDTPNGSSTPDESPVPSRNATPISSPSPDQRVIPVRNGVPMFQQPSSPRARHSIPVPSLVPDGQWERGSCGELIIPGLLFFLESTKAATSKSLRETKRDRRKSVSEGAGNALIQQELNAIDEEDEDDDIKPDETQKSPVENNNPTDIKSRSDSTDSNPPPSNTPPQSSPPPNQPSIRTTSPDPHPLSHSHPHPNGTPDTHDNNSKPMITVDPADDDDEDDDSPPGITVIPPPSPIVSRHANNNSGNSGEVGNSTLVPILKVTAIDKSSSPADSPNGHAESEINKSIADDDSDDSTIMDSPADSPRLRSLGMMTVSSVPNFSYFNTTAGGGTGSGPSPSPGPNSGSGSAPLPKSGSSSLRITSPLSNTGTLTKRGNRSASLTYVNLDPLCGNPHIPFYKNNDGGIPGATFVPLDTNNKSNEVYYIGLIDFLQKYNKKKKLAGFAKSLKYEKEELSTVDPVFYMERFLKMTERAVVE